MKKVYTIIAALSILATAKAQYTVSTYAGTGIAGLVNGSLVNAQFNHSFGMCRDQSGNIFIADNGNNCIRKITAAGVVSTYAGSSVAGYNDGVDTVALFNAPSGVCVDDSGNIYVADFQNQRIRKINTSGMVSTVAGSGIAGYNDGIGIAAQFNYPRGICIDASYNLYVGDSWNHRIRKISPGGNVTTYAGGGTAIGVGSVGAYVDASDTSARFYTPCGVVVDGQGNVYVADAYNHRIRKIDTGAMVSTVVGSGPTGVGQGGYANGPALSARLNVATELFVDSTGNIYIGDTFNNRVRKMSISSGMVINLAGNGSPGFVNGADSTAEFNYPRGIIAGDNDMVYVADYNNNCIRLISPLSTRINNLSNSNAVSIYPNPANDRVTIEYCSDSASENYLVLYTTNGRQLLHQDTKNGETTIDISAFPSGMYFMKLVTDNSIAVKKIIKQ
jgi:hypothetical protein